MTIKKMRVEGMKMRNNRSPKDAAFFIQMFGDRDNWQGIKAAFETESEDD